MEVFKSPEPQKQAFRPNGIIPHKLGHVAFHVTDVQGTTRFYCDVLGFRVSDWMGDHFSFLRCGVDHHTINLIETGSNKHFHTAFELRDWAHMQTACDFLSRNGYRMLWAPGRHGIGHNLLPSQPERTYYRAVRGTRSDERRIARLFRPAPVAPRQSSAPEDLAEGSERSQSLGSDATRRDDALASDGMVARRRALTSRSTKAGERSRSHWHRSRRWRQTPPAMPRRR